MLHRKMKEINVEIELAMQNAWGMIGRSYPISKEKYTKSMKLKTDYNLEFGACLRITDIFPNGCLYEEYGIEINRRSKSLAQKPPRKVGFARWNERVSIYVPYPPTDVICNLYVTFKVSASKKQSLPKTELILPKLKPNPEKNQEWICPECGTTISTDSIFCYNCGRERLRQVVSQSNICYFDAKGKVCEKESAATCIITEYDQNGNLINSVHGICNCEVSLTSKHNITAEPDDDETVWQCSVCGTFNRFINTHCSNCGQSR